MNGALRGALENPWLASVVSFLLVIAFLLVVFFCLPNPMPTGWIGLMRSIVALSQPISIAAKRPGGGLAMALLPVVEDGGAGRGAAGALR